MSGKNRPLMIFPCSAGVRGGRRARPQPAGRGRRGRHVPPGRGQCARRPGPARPAGARPSGGPAAAADGLPARHPCGAAGTGCQYGHDRHFSGQGHQRPVRRALPAQPCGRLRPDRGRAAAAADPAPARALRRRRHQRRAAPFAGRRPAAPAAAGRSGHQRRAGPRGRPGPSVACQRPAGAGSGRHRAPVRPHGRAGEHHPFRGLAPGTGLPQCGRPSGGRGRCAGHQRHGLSFPAGPAAAPGLSGCGRAFPHARLAAGPACGPAAPAGPDGAAPAPAVRAMAGRRRCGGAAQGQGRLLAGSGGPAAGRRAGRRRCGLSGPGRCSGRTLSARLSGRAGLFALRHGAACACRGQQLAGRRRPAGCRAPAPAALARWCAAATLVPVAEDPGFHADYLRHMRFGV